MENIEFQGNTTNIEDFVENFDYPTFLVVLAIRMDKYFEGGQKEVLKEHKQELIKILKHYHNKIKDGGRKYEDGLHDEIDFFIPLQQAILKNSNKNIKEEDMGYEELSLELKLFISELENIELNPNEADSLPSFLVKYSRKVAANSYSLNNIRSRLVA